jgi:hypothetical protein
MSPFTPLTVNKSGKIASVFQFIRSSVKVPLPLKPSCRRGLFTDCQAQVAVWGLLSLLVLVLIAGGLVDIYRFYAARNWAYTVAQEAALTGASKGRDWSVVTEDGSIRLIAEVSRVQAQKLVFAEMNTRGVSGYSVDVRVIPDPTGGVISDYPPRPVRLGESLGDWSTDEPAVGVYLTVPVQWVLLDQFGLLERTVSAFASAGVAN